MPKSKRCVFLGYATQQKGYRCLDMETREMRVCRNVIFDKDSFPFLDYANPRMVHRHNTKPIEFVTQSRIPSPGHIGNNHSSSVPDHQVTDMSHDLSSLGRSHYDSLPNNGHSLDSSRSLYDQDTPNSSSIPSIVSPSSTSIGESDSSSSINPNIDRRVTLDLNPSLNPSTQNNTSSDLRRSVREKFPNVLYKDFQCNNHSSTNVLCEPSSFSQDNKHQCWKEAMQEEIKAINDKKLGYWYLGRHI